MTVNGERAPVTPDSGTSAERRGLRALVHKIADVCIALAWGRAAVGYNGDYAPFNMPVSPEVCDRVMGGPLTPDEVSPPTHGRPVPPPAGSSLGPVLTYDEAMSRYRALEEQSGQQQAVQSSQDDLAGAGHR